MATFVLPPYLHLLVQIIGPSLSGYVLCSYVLLLIRGKVISGDVAYSYVGSDDARPLEVLFFARSAE